MNVYTTLDFIRSMTLIILIMQARQSTTNKSMALHLIDISFNYINNYITVEKKASTLGLNYTFYRLYIYRNIMRIHSSLNSQIMRLYVSSV